VLRISIFQNPRVSLTLAHPLARDAARARATCSSVSAHGRPIFWISVTSLVAALALPCTFGCKSVRAPLAAPTTGSRAAVVYFYVDSVGLHLSAAARTCDLRSAMELATRKGDPI